MLSTDFNIVVFFEIIGFIPAQLKGLHLIWFKIKLSIHLGPDHFEKQSPSYYKKSSIFDLKF